MGHKDALQTWKPESFRLRIGGNYKRIRGDEHRRHTASFKIGYVVHTARRTTASIGERFDYQRALGGDFVAQIDWGWFGESRLAKAQNLGASRSESRFELIQKNIATSFRNIKQTNCLAR